MALCVGAAQWNLWAPKDLKGTLGIGLTNVDYAFMAELMGAYVMGAEVFNLVQWDLHATPWRTDVHISVARQPRA